MSVARAEHEVMKDYNSGRDKFTSLLKLKGTMT
jgi:hypothetical protein